MRIDLYLYTNGLCRSRSKAQKVLSDRRVSVNGEIVTKTSFDVTESDVVSVSETAETEFVGRGGNKLEHAVSSFKIDVAGKTCLDIGASTGGFTQCLLMHGATKVYSVDSGRGQLADELIRDNRVVSIEGFNARNLTSDDLDCLLMDIVVMDVSFISQKLLYPAILRVANKGADVITLIKPQFEAGKQNIGKRGIVKDPKVRIAVVEDIIKCSTEMGFEYIDHIESPITGGDGNVEYLLHLRIK